MSGPEGMPNGVDRLAQIEEWRKEGTLGQISVSDVLALVEIAKAARDVLRIVERDTTEVNALRAALVRLDSGATEGDQ